jgi:hypothetical protein
MIAVPVTLRGPSTESDPEPAFSRRRQAGCPWEPYPPLTFRDQCSLVAIPSGANFTFEIPEGEDPVLNVIGLPGDGHNCSARSTGQDR